MKNVLCIVYICALVGVMLAGCESTDKPLIVSTPDKTEIGVKVFEKELERLRVISTAVATADAANTQNPQQNEHTGAVKDQLGIAKQLLPYSEADAEWLAQRVSELETERNKARIEASTLADVAKGLESDIAALKEQHQKELEAQAALIQRRINEAIENERNAMNEAKQAAQAKNTAILTIMGGICFVIGVIALWNGHQRLGTGSFIAGAALLAFARALTSIPEWVWSASLGVCVFAGIGFAFYTYKVGKYQKPEPEQRGDYTFHPQPKPLSTKDDISSDDK